MTFCCHHFLYYCFLPFILLMRLPSICNDVLRVIMMTFVATIFLFFCPGFYLLFTKFYLRLSPYLFSVDFLLLSLKCFFMLCVRHIFLYTLPPPLPALSYFGAPQHHTTKQHLQQPFSSLPPQRVCCDTLFASPKWHTGRPSTLPRAPSVVLFCDQDLRLRARSPQPDIWTWPQGDAYTCRWVSIVMQSTPLMHPPVLSALLLFRFVSFSFLVHFYIARQVQFFECVLWLKRLPFNSLSSLLFSKLFDLFKQICNFSVPFYFFLTSFITKDASLCNLSCLNNYTSSLSSGHIPPNLHKWKWVECS